MPRVECSFAHMWFEEKVTEGLVDKLSFSWMRLYSENENVICGTFQKGDYLCQRHVISKANSLSTMFSSVRSLSCVRLFATPWTAAHQASLSITNSRSLPKLMSIESLMQFSHLILCRPLLLLPPIPRSIRVFSTTFSSVQISSVAQSCLTLCDPVNHSMPGLPVHHQLPEFTQTHVHWIGDAIQPSHPPSFPSPPALNPSQLQGLFQWVNSSHEVAKVLEFRL